MTDIQKNTLGFEEIPSGPTGVVAGRKYVRDNYTQGRQVYKIAFNKILVREGANKREVYKNIDDLADSIAAHGLQTPFDLIVLKDGSGKVYIKRGHRRHRAIELLIEQGRFKATDEVEFFYVESSESELEWMIDQYVSNNNQMPYTSLETAEVARSIKYDFGKKRSNEEVANLLFATNKTLSRQTVDNLILVAEQTEGFKNRIRAGKLSFKEAVQFLRDKKKETKVKEDPKPELAAAQTTAKVAEPKDALKQDLTELQKLNEFVHANGNRNGGVIVDGQSLQVGQSYGLAELELEEEDEEEKQGKLLDEHIAIVAAAKQTKKQDKKLGKAKYDENRPEIVLCQNIIKNMDSLYIIAAKVEPKQTGDDLVQKINFVMTDIMELREWVNKNIKR